MLSFCCPRSGNTNLLVCVRPSKGIINMSTVKRAHQLHSLLTIRGNSTSLLIYSLRTHCKHEFMVAISSFISSIKHDVPLLNYGHLESNGP